MPSYTLAFSPDLSTDAYICIAAALIIGILNTWLYCSGSKKAAVATIAAQLEIERSNSLQANQRLATSLEDVNALRRSEANLIQTRAELTAKINSLEENSTNKENISNDIQAKIGETLKNISTESIKSNQEQFIKLAQESIGSQKQQITHDLTEHKNKVETILLPLSTSIEKINQQLQKIEENNEQSQNHIQQQFKNLAESQREFQEETTQLIQNPKESTNISASLINEISRNPKVKRTLSIPSESKKPFEPIDSLVDDNDDEDFSPDSLEEEFRGFTASSDGEGI